MTHTKTNIVQYNEYYPFGLQASTSWTREHSTNNFLYNNGAELNTTSGLYDTFYRGFDPALGRFMQVDPLAHEYHSVTPYQYALNNPALLNDPNGDKVSNMYTRMYEGFHAWEHRAGGYDRWMQDTGFDSWFSTGFGGGTGSSENNDFFRTVESMAANAGDGETEIYGYSGKHDAYGFWLETSFTGTPNFQTGLLNEIVKLARFMEWNFGSKQQVQGGCPTCPGSNYIAGLSPGFTIDPGSGRRDISDEKNYPGIKIYETNGVVKGTAVTIPGAGIFIHPTITGLDRKQTLQHEYGHFLDYKFGPDLNFMGTPSSWLNYMFIIGIPSALDLMRGSNYEEHHNFYTEKRADQWAEIWFGSNYAGK